MQISVDKVSMKSLQEREEEIYRASEMANASIKAFKDTLVITSRKLITGKSWFCDLCNITHFNCP
jgi:hypothetical protein